jgi:nitrile hydratase accessory protein
LIYGRNTLSQPDTNLDAKRIEALPPLPQDEEGPIFAEPWQAHAFALAVKLSEQGHFTWKEWATALADELKAAAERGTPDDGTRYYNHWVAAPAAQVNSRRKRWPYPQGAFSA